MKFGVFYEHQLPRPWGEGDELRLFQDALEQVELADRLGFDSAWEVEHHFLEEYSHSSAPEVFLAACSQRTKRIRLGHGIVLMPPGYSHPAKIASRIATLDLVSNGRVDFGTGESASRLELEGYGIDPAEKKAMWREATEQVCNLLVMDPYPGYEGKYFSMPCRNLVPKPVQKPHPPLWVACSNRNTILEAARLGIGALTFAFIDQNEARQWVRDYYATFERECVPIGHAVNPNIAIVAGFSVHPEQTEAERRGATGFKFFGFALGHHYVYGEQRPGRTSIWENFEKYLEPVPRPRRPRDRHAGGGARVPPVDDRDGRGPDRIHPAGGPEPSRAHLREPRAVRARRDARVPREGGRARAPQGRAPRARDRCGARAEAEARAARGRRDPDREGVRAPRRADPAPDPGQVT